MHTYLYIHLYIHIYIPKQAIRVAKLCFYCVFFFKKTIMLRSRDLDFVLELYFLRNPYTYVSSTGIQNLIKIDEWNLGKSLLLCEIECKTFRSICLISYVLNDRICSNSVKRFLGT